jgi:hypothetical protein
MVDLAELRMEMGQPAEAVRLLEGALPLAAARSGRAEAQVTARLARAARLAGDPNVLARCARALELAERAGDRALTHGVLTDLAVAAARIGDRGASAAALRRARDLAAFAEDARPSLLLDLRAAQVDLLQGDARSARDRAIEVAPRLAAAGDRAAAVAAGLIASESARRLGDAGVAVVAAERARLWADRADPDVEGLVKLAEAQAWLSAGRPARARRLARSVRAPGVSRAVDEAAARSLAVSAAREGFGAVSDSAATAWAASKDTRRRLRRGDRMPVPASTLRGAFVVAAARWEEVAEHAARRRDDVAVAEALVRVAWAWRSAGDDARLAAAVDAARRSLESLSDPATVRRLRASTERALLDT